MIAVNWNAWRGSIAHRLPVVRQNELTECGLACLAMIGRYHGHDVDLASLRRRYPTSLKGASLRQLIDVADSLGLAARPLRVEMDYLGQLRLPCILHWNMSHFVVLRSVTRNGLVIHDPAVGVREVLLSEADRSFTGVALELLPVTDFRPIKARSRLSLSGLLGRVRGLRTAATQILLLALALEVLTLVSPLLMQWVLDHVLASADYTLLPLLGIGFLFLVLFQATTQALRGWLAAGVGASVAAQWTSNLFGHLLRLPLSFLEKRSVGDVMSRFVSLQLMQQTLSGNLIETLLDGLTVVLVIAVLFVYSPPLTLVVLAALGLYAAARWAAFRAIYRLSEDRMVFAARQHGQMLESLHGALSIRLANAQAQRRARVTNTAVEVAQREAAIQRTTASFRAFSTFVFGALRVVLVWAGAWLALSGRFTAGMMVVFVAYADMLATRGGALIDRWVDLKLLGLHAERVADIALEPPEEHTESGYVGGKLPMRIEVENLGFRYSDEDPWILRNCSFTILPGESVAIVGASGCGKTTLAKMLLGLLAPTEGAITIGDVDIRRFGLNAYRALFGAVMQDEKLFAGSVAENISFFDEQATLRRIEEAARMAQIRDDILAMPMGFETLVGDMGSALSGGQRQRVLLARALYRDPPLLLLDEATSHLDIARERAVNDTISQLKTTRIFIAHRPETIASADRVLELRDGQVREYSIAAYLHRQGMRPPRSQDSDPAVDKELGESFA